MVPWQAPTGRALGWVAIHDSALVPASLTKQLAGVRGRMLSLRVPLLGPVVTLWFKVQTTGNVPCEQF